MGSACYNIIFQKLVTSFKSHYDKIGAKNVVMGLSGGLDSAFAAVVVSEAVGVSNFKPYYLPYKTSVSQSFKDAELLCKTFNLSLETIDISSVADAFFNLTPDIDNLRKGNVLARLRMTTLFDRAKSLGGIVAGTSNKSEILLGYSTWFGDLASSINVLGELYKTDIREIASSVGVPCDIISKKPSADFWEGQTDEGDLGFTYEEADKIFYSAIELGMDRSHIYNIFGKGLVKSVALRVIRNAFKRRMPLVCSVYSDNAGSEQVNEIFKQLL